MIYLSRGDKSSTQILLIYLVLNDQYVSKERIVVNKGNFSNELELLNNLNPVETLGILNLTTPNKASGNRLQMTTGFYEQCIILKNGEVPDMFTGYEHEIGQYNDGRKIAKTNYEVIDKIDKYPNLPGYHYMLIVKDTINNVIDAIEVKHYESLSEDHGYIRKQTLTDLVNTGDNIPKGQLIQENTTHDDYGNFKQGINANVAYISRQDNIEDGIVVSRSFSEKIKFWAIEKIEMTIGYNDIGLNLYGDKDIYKVMPDIHENTNNGIFSGIRTIEHSKAASNVTIHSLMHPNTSDTLYHGEGTLLDVDIYVNNPDELNNDEYRSQYLKYYQLASYYNHRIEKALKKYINNRKGLKCTSKANYIYTRAKEYNNINEKYANSNGVFEFVYIKAYVGRERSLFEGSKLANRFGGKGVISHILPDDEMPVDDRGVVADVILNPLGIVNRSNPGQSYEHELNYISENVRRKMMRMDNINDQYNILQKLLDMTDFEYANHFRQKYMMSPDSVKVMIIQEAMNSGIKIRQHPFNNVSLEDMKNIYLEFGSNISYVKSKVRTQDGKVKIYKSKTPIIIASEYLLILKHTTDSKFSSVSISDVNSLGLPAKNNKSNKHAPYRTTPIRCGEMEYGNILTRVKPSQMNRFIAASLNLKHRMAVADLCLNGDPLNLGDVDVDSDDIVDSIASETFLALMFQAGYSVRETEKVSELEVECIEKELDPKHIKGNTYTIYTE